MKRTTLAVICAAAAFNGLAQAETLTLDGNVSSVCSFGSPIDGSLTVNGTAISTLSAASIAVTNNAASTYSLTMASGVLASAPGSLALVGDVAMSPGSVSGPNVGVAWTGSDAAGYTKALTATGTDIVSVSDTATLDATAQPGVYSITHTITCS